MRRALLGHKKITAVTPCDHTLIDYNVRTKKRGGEFQTRVAAWQHVIPPKVFLFFMGDGRFTDRPECRFIAGNGYL